MGGGTSVAGLGCGGVSELLPLELDTDLFIIIKLFVLVAGDGFDKLNALILVLFAERDFLRLSATLSLEIGGNVALLVGGLL